MPVDRRPLADMDEDIYPYQRLIDNGLASVMAAHVVFAEVDPLPAGFSRRWLQDELRGRMGFGGAIFSDDLSMAGAGVVGDMPERVRAALAGRLRHRSDLQQSPRCAPGHRFFSGEAEIL